MHENIKYDHIIRMIEEITSWIVYEPNNESTWSRVREVVSHYLYQLWLDGDLECAATSEAYDAYTVKCDSDTNTVDDQYTGRFNFEVMIATKTPANFDYIIRVTHMAEQ